MGSLVLRGSAPSVQQCGGGRETTKKAKLNYTNAVLLFLFVSCCFGLLLIELKVKSLPNSIMSALGQRSAQIVTCHQRYVHASSEPNVFLCVAPPKLEKLRLLE